VSEVLNTEITIFHEEISGQFGLHTKPTIIIFIFKFGEMYGISSTVFSARLTIAWSFKFLRKVC